MKLTPQGVLVWVKSWGGAGNEALRVVVSDPQGNLLVTGDFDETISLGTTVLQSQGGTDVFVAKLTGDGQPLWSRRMGGASDDLSGRMAVDSLGNLIVSGQFLGSGNFGGTSVLTSHGDWDAFIAKWSSAGEPMWARQVGGPATDVSWGVAVAVSDDVVVSGLFEDQVDFGEGARVSRGSADAFVLKLSAAGKFVWSHDFGGAGWDSTGSVVTDASGRAYVVGWYQAPADLGGGTLTNDGMYVLQLAP
jgi:hypothetical protein